MKVEVICAMNRQVSLTRDADGPRPKSFHGHGWVVSRTLSRVESSYMRLEEAPSDYTYMYICMCKRHVEMSISMEIEPQIFTNKMLGIVSSPR